MPILTLYEASETKPLIISANYDPGLTMTLCTAWSNFATEAFTWETVIMMDSFEIIALCDLEFGK